MHQNTTVSKPNIGSDRTQVLKKIFKDPLFYDKRLCTLFSLHSKQKQTSCIMSFLSVNVQTDRRHKSCTNFETVYARSTPLFAVKILIRSNISAYQLLKHVRNVTAEFLYTFYIIIRCRFYNVVLSIKLRNLTCSLAHEYCTPDT